MTLDSVEPRETSELTRAVLPLLAQEGPLLVAYSGGLDSHVLLDLLVTANIRSGQRSRIRAIHVNHGLNVHALRWQEHCEAVCKRLGVPLLVRSVALDAAGGNLEKKARDARYEAFESVLEEGEALVLAHHRDDQVETILQRLIRGVGSPGAAGMPGERPFGRGRLVRPFLEVGRAQLVTHAKSRDLSWIEDESNADDSFDRNYLRHRIIPALTRRWRGVAETVSRSGSLLREAALLNRDLAEIDLGEPVEAAGSRLDVRKLLGLSESRQRNLLYHWITGKGFSAPSHAQLEQVIKQLCPARVAGTPFVAWRGGELRRYHYDIYLMKTMPAHDARAEFLLDEALSGSAPDRFEVPLAGGTLRASKGRRQGLCSLDPLSLAVRFRRGGERCRPAGRGGSRPLKKVFQESGVPPWLRDRVPLLYHDDELVAAAGLFVSEAFATADGVAGWHFEWTYGSASPDESSVEEGGRSWYS